MRVVIFPAPGGPEGEELFAPRENDWHIVALETKRQVEAQGWELAVWPCEVSQTDFGIVFEHHLKLPRMDRKICILQEPPVVRPRPYEIITGLPYDRVLTFCRPYVDNKLIHFMPFNTPSYTKDLSRIHRDGYICAISGNKSFNHPEALYQARRQAYLSWGKDLDLYGHGWALDAEIMATCNYKGIVQDKVSTLARYKFAIVFENQIIHGWNSEKLYHCLQSGTVPLYRGSKEDVLPLSEVTEVRWNERLIQHIKDVLG
jgi:hypothetical protein